VASASSGRWREPYDYLETTKRRLLEREDDLISELKGFEVSSRLRELFDHAKMSRESPDTDVDRTLNDGLDGLRAKLQPIEPPPSEATSGNAYVLPLLYSWVSQTEEFSSFFSGRERPEGPCNRVLWVTGPPGAGKTMLMRAVVQGLLEERRALLSIESFSLAYFFCDSHDQPHGYATQVLKSLIWQILKSQPSLVGHMENQFSSTGRTTFNDPNDFYALSTVLYRMIDGIPDGDANLEFTYIIVDAIEELCANENSESPLCSGPSIDDLIQLIIKTSQRSPHIRWLVSVDRPRVSTEHHQGPVELLPKSIIAQGTLKIDDKRYLPRLNQDVVREYISFKLAEVGRQARFKDSFRNQVNEKLIAKAPPNLLWVDMACRRIVEHGLPWNAIAIVDKLPVEIRDLYLEAYLAIDKFDSLDDQTMCRDLLVTTAISFRALHKSEVRSLVTMPPYVDLDIVVQKMCSFFLKVHAGKVCYVHPSAKEFVRDTLHGDERISAQHLRVMRRCLQNATAKVVSGSETYVVMNWMQHLCSINNDKDLNDAIQDVNQFFNNYFLEWAEVLATQKLLAEAAVWLRKLTTSLRKPVRARAPFPYR
jgi:hypothetical protein